MAALLHRLHRDRTGAALLEFALGLPVLLAMGGYGVELCNLAVTNMRVSQIAIMLADNASRVGAYQASAASYQLQEGDINDILQGARLMGQGLKLTTYGRVTISSLENIQRSDLGDTAAVQRLHWQRCIGMMSGYPAQGAPTVPVYDSTYGQATPLATAGTDATAGNAGQKSTGIGSTPVVTAPSNNGVIFIEVNYQYQPLFGTMFASKTIIHYVASFLVRDNRDYTQIYNSKTALGTTPTPSTCNLHAA